jgi:DNA-binding PadR family transcriptional regulator
MRRGFLRFYLLKLIAESDGELSGYALMKKIEEETGFWRPSPGSIYPLFASLEAAGRLVHRAVGEKKIYSLTAAGETALAKAHAAREEAVSSIRHSMQIFSQLFEVEEAALTPFSDVGRRSLPVPLRRPVRTLRHLLPILVSQGPSDAEAREIAAILNRAIEELKVYVKGH